MLKRRCFLLGFLTLAVAPQAWAGESLLLAAGAGYKKPFEALCARFSEQGGGEVRRLYGNIQQILAQAERDGRVDVLIGEADFLDRSALRFDARERLGEGRLVLAYAKGVQLEQPQQVVELARVAMPDPRQAIFGRAAKEYIEHNALVFKNPPKVVSTVPQVTAYLLSGEIDAGFINLTEALALGERLGGWIELPTRDYTPPRIEAALPHQEPAHPQREAFMRFLQSDEARAILQRYGL